jgi:hypothetical protein
MNLRTLVVVFLATTAAASAQPAIEIDGGTSFDFGTISKGTVVEKKVILKNTGTETLELGRVDASCGCTGTILSDQKIEPGKTGTLQITFNSRNFSGPVHKSVTVHSNSQAAPSLLLEFTATVMEEITLTPPQIWFRDAEVGVVSTALLTIKNQGKSALRLTGVKTQLEGLTLKLPEGAIEPGASAQIIAEYKAKVARPVLSDGVFVTTTSNSQPQIFIQIYGNVKDFKFN